MVTWLRALLTSLVPIAHPTLLSIADSHHKELPSPVTISLLVPHPGPLLTLGCFRPHSVQHPTGMNFLAPQQVLELVYLIELCFVTSYSFDQPDENKDDMGSLLYPCITCASFLALLFCSFDSYFGTLE